MTAQAQHKNAYNAPWAPAAGPSPARPWRAAWSAAPAGSPAPTPARWVGGVSPSRATPTQAVQTRLDGAVVAAGHESPSVRRRHQRAHGACVSRQLVRASASALRRARVARQRRGVDAAVHGAREERPVGGVERERREGSREDERAQQHAAAQAPHLGAAVQRHGRHHRHARADAPRHAGDGQRVRRPGVCRRGRSRSTRCALAQPNRQLCSGARQRRADMLRQRATRLRATRRRRWCRRHRRRAMSRRARRRAQTQPCGAPARCAAACRCRCATAAACRRRCRRSTARRRASPRARTQPRRRSNAAPAARAPTSTRAARPCCFALQPHRGASAHAGAVRKAPQRTGQEVRRPEPAQAAARGGVVFVRRQQRARLQVPARRAAVSDAPPDAPAVLRTTLAAAPRCSTPTAPPPPAHPWTPSRARPSAGGARGLQQL